MLPGRSLRSILGWVVGGSVFLCLVILANSCGDEGFLHAACTVRAYVRAYVRAQRDATLRSSPISPKLTFYTWDFSRRRLTDQPPFPLRLAPALESLGFYAPFPARWSHP